MSFKKIYILILIVLFNNPFGYTQSIKYSNPISYNSNDFFFRITGQVGNNIHIWRTPMTIIGKVKETSLLTLFIFSDQMKLIAEKNIPVADISVAYIDLAFHITGNNYYMSVNYTNSDSIVKRQLFKVNEEGAYADYSSHLEKWNEADSGIFNSAQLAILRNKRFSFIANTAQINALQLENQGQENQSSPENKISIYKVNLENQQTVAQVKYTAPTFNFDHPRIAKDDDKALWICSSKGSVFENKKDSLSKFSFFLVKLDSNLEELSGGVKFLKDNPSIIKTKSSYSLEDIFMIDKKLFLISLGRHKSTYYSPEMDFLRISKVDESENVLMDSLINVSAFDTNLQLWNSYYSFSNQEIHLFFQQQFPHKLNGIRHIVIGKNFIKENDIQVDPRYSYNLHNSKRIDETTYIIPFTHHGKIGFMKCSYINQTD